MKIQTNEYEAAAYLALPHGRPAPGVLVLHPWWGLNEDIREICDHLAEAGFVALAPDLYDGRIATTIEEAEKFVEAMDEDAARELTRAATTALLAHEACQGPKIGVVGFSLGAMYGVWIAHAQPDQVAAVVLFYGAGWVDQTNTQASYMGHFAENDPYEDADYLKQFEQKLREHGRPTTIHIYPGAGHWFFEPSRPDAYDPAAAERAWERTLAFLKETIS